MHIVHINETSITVNDKFENEGKIHLASTTKKKLS